jgi:carbamoylphosphate synthase small subunit
LYAFQDLTEINGSIAFIQVGVQLAMAATGSRNVKIKYRDDGGTEADVSTVTVASTAYDEFYAVMDQNPAVPADWDITDINGGQFGVEVV